MKLAIQGHPTRGKEVIRILESLGSKNGYDQSGSNEDFVYFINSVGLIYSVALQMCSNERRIYTLEEFEKEFPFKVGDRVISITTGCIGTITKLSENGWYYVNYDNGNFACAFGQNLKPYKEMERNVTLTLDKAKEWYKKGGELREIALQVFTEKELNLLPRSWEEFCKRGNPLSSWRYNIPIKYEALFKLEQLRNCYNNSCNDISRIAIINNNGNIELYVDPPFNCFLTFKNHLLAREFFSNFKEIIEIAKELI